ncbi:ABC transporter ATP-binding protein [Calothrix sp. NIES-3974]|uniref:ABC transporter ATP-binding protein n=1 Tax=Calothrix sp. NIES-3974 TaxID=2005462 RepID=UPI000B5DBAA6|nr:ABC transporter ATP-binding protein [Calothrix sp. NIES-3974]
MFKQNLFFQFLKKYPILIIAAIILGFSGALFNGISTALIVPVILKIVGQEVDLRDSPSLIKAIMAPFDDIDEQYRAMVMSGAIILTLLLKNMASYASAIAAGSLKRKIATQMREDAIDMLMSVDINYFAKSKLGDLMNRFNGEIPKAATSLSNFVRLVTLSITILVFLSILLSISWELTICSTILLSLVTIVNQYPIYRSRSLGKELSESSKLLTNSMIETISGIRIIKGNTHEEITKKKINSLVQRKEDAEYKSQLFAEIIAPSGEFVGIVALILIVFIARFIFADRIASLSAILLSYLLVLMRLLPFLSQLNNLRSTFANNAAAVDFVVDFLRRDNKPFMGNGNIQLPELRDKIEFKDLIFSYPGQEKQVLKGVNLTLPKGTTLALVGSSGAGKSTLADLLPRFYEPDSGCIMIDGIDLRDYDIKSVREKMGIVSQDTFLFNDTVLNNIAYGRPGATEDDVIQAAQRANAYEFIVKLPQGFATIVGDRGVMLSGGQRQRISIARALLRDPEILILDEATSALDTVSERLVQQAIDELSCDRTTLVIAHRLSTIKNADQIAVMDQGRVVELGTHDELLEKGSYYSRLYSMQFSEDGNNSVSEKLVVNG